MENETPSRSVAAIAEHYAQRWQGDYELLAFQHGPNASFAPELRIAVFEPAEGNKLWRYATCGMSDLRAMPAIELHLFSLEWDEGNLELLTAAAFYHFKTAALNLGHTVNFGRPWQSNSQLCCGFISLPYHEDIDFEQFEFDSKTIHCYWLIPITEAERDLRLSEGVEALEQRFDEHELRYYDPFRAAVV